VYTYADGTTLVITANNISEIQTLAQSELNNLVYYFHNNNLVTNPTKTNFHLYPATPDQSISASTTTQSTKNLSQTSRTNDPGKSQTPPYH
jgi:hypothetical protein